MQMYQSGVSVSRPSGKFHNKGGTDDSEVLDSRDFELTPPRDAVPLSAHPSDMLRRRAGDYEAQKSKGVTKPVKRGATSGWTPGVSRRNTQFLMSMAYANLSGKPYSVTLTIPADRIPTSAEYAMMRKRFIDNGFKRKNWIRVYWLVEFTRKGTPHMHMTIWVPEEIPADQVEMEIFLNWSKICRKRGIEISMSAQDIKPVENGIWNRYLSKHGARGSSHYQRAKVPESWQKSSGRVWGYCGDWGVKEDRQPVRAEISDRKVFFQTRRILRHLRVIEARQVKNEEHRSKAISSARRMLKTNRRELSEVRAITFKTWSDSLDDGESRGVALGTEILRAIEIKNTPTFQTDRQKRIQILAVEQGLRHLLKSQELLAQTP